MNGEAPTKSTLRVVNANGLHARPCHAVVTLALKHKATVAIGYGGRTVNGKSILELMTLNAAQGAVLSVEAVGEDAARLVAALEQLFASGFGEVA